MHGPRSAARAIRFSAQARCCILGWACRMGGKLFALLVPLWAMLALPPQAQGELRRLAVLVLRARSADPVFVPPQDRRVETRVGVALKQQCRAGGRVKSQEANSLPPGLSKSGVKTGPVTTSRAPVVSPPPCMYPLAGVPPSALEFGADEDGA
jgi:hypothetical protein